MSVERRAGKTIVTHPPVPLQHSQPASRRLPFRLVPSKPPEVDEFALACNRYDGHQSDWIVRPCESIETLFGAFCLSFPDLEDHLMRLTWFESEEGDLKADKQFPVSAESVRNFVSRETALTELD